MQLLTARNERVKEIVGRATSGTTISVSEAPDEVREFSATAKNGQLVSGWTYSDGTVTLPASVSGDVAVAISDGVYLFDRRYMCQGLCNVAEETLIIKDTCNLKDLTIDIDGPNYDNTTIKWVDEIGEHDFPFTYSYLPAGQELRVTVRVYLGSEGLGYYRDVWLKISAFRVE